MDGKPFLSFFRQLSSASTDSSQWISKYQKAEEDRTAAASEKDRMERDLRAQLSQAEQRCLQAQTKLSQAEQQANDAQAVLTREREEFEQRLQAAQAQARVAPQATASTAPGKQGRLTAFHVSLFLCLGDEHTVLT